jgi:hypothetical protein
MAVAKSSAATKAAQTRKKSAANEAAIIELDTVRKSAAKSVDTAVAKATARKSAAVDKSAATKSAAKKAAPATSAETTKSVPAFQEETRSVTELVSTLRGVSADDVDNVTKLATQLDKLETKMRDDDVPGRAMPATDDSTKEHAQRDETVRALLALGVGYDFVARIRRQPSSSNRGQCRLMCGLSRWDRVSDDTAELSAAQRKSYDASRAEGVSHLDALAAATKAPAAKRTARKS